MIPNREFPDTFHAYLTDSLNTVISGEDAHTRGHYNSAQAFHHTIYACTTAALKMETLKLEVNSAIRGWIILRGDRVTATTVYGE